MSQEHSTALVGVVMGSQSDWPTMEESAKLLEHFAIPFEVRITSAHRTPKRMVDYAETARERGLKVIIAGAGGAAHLPGMIASETSLPVLGVPIQSKALNGIDSLLSIVQMPGGIPVGTMAIGTAGAKNAAIMAARILSLSDKNLAAKLKDFAEDMANAVGLDPRIEQDPNQQI